MSPPLDGWLNLREALRAEALAIGFDLARFAAPRPPPGAAHLTDWLAAGCQGGMAWLAREPAQRQDPRQGWPALQAVLVVGVNYRPPQPPVGAPPGSGWIAHYARGQDYHPWIEARLRHLTAWLAAQGHAEPAPRLCVDAAPVMEKPLAVAAGLGWQGKNTLLANRRFGCWLFLGELLLALPLPPDDDLEPDRCGACVRCLEACPTGAFNAPYQLDARRCLAYLTIEHRGPIPVELRPALGVRVYGCDDCLTACPWNRFAPTAAPAWRPRPGLLAPTLEELATLEQANFRAVFADSPIQLLCMNRLLRNVAVALGNQGGPRSLPPLLGLVNRPSALVRQHAAWSLGQLGAWKALQDRRKVETDPAVLQELDSALG